MDPLQLNRVYRHYKGGLYLTHALAEHAESGEQLVIYRHLKSGALYAQPLSIFTQVVWKSAGSASSRVAVPRFALLEPEDWPKVF